jgi:hypothetical protein
MGGERSPNYPALGLSTALRHVEALWKAESRTAVPPDVAVKAMGYGAMSGTARVVLGALKQFGLLEKTAQNVRLSDLAVRILHPPNDDERQDAIREAALTPPLFRDLARTHAKASDAAISSYLVTQRQFVARGVRECIKAFRDTMALAGLTEGGYTQPKDRPPDAIAPSHSPAPTPTPHPPTPTEGMMGPGVLLLKVPFMDTELSVRIESNGGRLTALHIGRIRRYLELAEDDLRQTPKSEEPKDS